MQMPLRGKASIRGNGENPCKDSLKYDHLLQGYVLVELIMFSTELVVFPLTLPERFIILLSLVVFLCSEARPCLPEY